MDAASNVVPISSVAFLIRALILLIRMDRSPFAMLMVSLVSETLVYEQSLTPKT